MQGNTQQEKFLSERPFVVVDKYGHRRMFTVAGYAALLKKRHERLAKKIAEARS